ncbi:helix-turn-helix transcriptional regulator [Nonomuraea sp. NEAU-A123]|uniref:helix-turn-helix domain-containing protein n=1 Tax=Nonomuraea sp. NEAU-A123 TaxID=2839649 RepID=UPI001BE45F27|nr:helix-turn-helix transcriptional regulator [Nonomuraea sp. NEAU-A123]MBT2232300.1 helix-turn-helix domain-containing protein [Nonomuraea sp. NEAU-A123]
MVQDPAGFGRELRRRRLAAGLTLTGLSKLVHYSKGQLSKVERGLKAPSRELARLCDNTLGAAGELAALVRIQPTSTEATEARNGEEVWLMALSGDGQSWFQPLSRRQVMTMGVASAAGMSIGRPDTSFPAGGTTLLGTSRTLFDNYRQLGQVAGPGALLPALIAQTHSLQELSSGTGPRTRGGLLQLASRYAEYAGWMMQEIGNDQGALWWTRHAVDLAAAGGDRDLAAYGHVRHALVTLYRDDAAQTIELARRAQKPMLPPRIRGLAAQREAQGHALAGDYDACMRSLDRARVLLTGVRSQPDGPPVIGTTNLPDPVGMITGWCLYDLGRPRDAAEVMGKQMAHVPPHALRTRVRYGMRRALAHAMAGEIEHACDLTGQLLGAAATVSSATIAQDMRALARTLSRHPRNVAVRRVAPELGTALQFVNS